MSYLGYENITVLRNVDINMPVERRNIPKDFNLYQHRCENLKSRKVIPTCLPQNKQHFSLNIYKLTIYIVKRHHCNMKSNEEATIRLEV